MTFTEDSQRRIDSSGQITTFVREGEKLAGLQEETKTTCVWLLEERTRGMCSIRGNRMHSLNQLPANPVAQSHILIFITARVGIHTSTSHGVFPRNPLSICFGHLLHRSFICSIHVSQSPTRRWHSVQTWAFCESILSHWWFVRPWWFVCSDLEGFTLLL